VAQAPLSAQACQLEKSVRASSYDLLEGRCFYHEEVTAAVALNPRTS